MNRILRWEVVALAALTVMAGLIAAPQRCVAQQADSTGATEKVITPAPNEQAGVLSSLRFVAAPGLGTNEPGNNGPANTGPVLLALADVAGVGTAAAGGLWLSGDTAVGLKHLQWIAGNQPAGLLKVDRAGKVSFNLRLLASATGVTSENTAVQRERIASFVRSDEGLRLLAELTNGPHRFMLHVGSSAPTLGGNIRFVSLLNLDKRFDSRINPRRRNGQKANDECPPEGFDSLIAVNPGVTWFNVHNRQLMPPSQIVFHELAEAHARLTLGFDYVPQEGKPGAHDLAIYREVRLKQERPWQVIVMPVGSNIVLTSRDDWMRLFVQLRE